MKKVIVFIIILININSHAQTYSPSLLIGTKRQCVERFSDPTIKWEFSKEEIHETVNRKIMVAMRWFSIPRFFQTSGSLN